MESLLQNRIINSVAIMVIDIENKTNIEAKREIRKRLNHIMNINVSSVLASIEAENNAEIKEMLYKCGEAEVKNITKQFDYQIDQLIPQELYMAREETEYLKVE